MQPSSASAAVIGCQRLLPSSLPDRCIRRLIPFDVEMKVESRENQPSAASADRSGADRESGAAERPDPSKKTDDGKPHAPAENGQKPPSNAKDPSRPRRKKARRACFACQRAHLTCGMLCSVYPAGEPAVRIAHLLHYSRSSAEVLTFYFAQGMRDHVNGVSSAVCKMPAPTVSERRRSIFTMRRMAR